MDASPPAHARNTDISLSLARVLPFWLGILAATACGAAMASGRFDGSLTTRVIGAVLLVAFGLLALAVAYMALTQRGPLVNLSRDGIRDVRIAPEIIPWSEVRGLRSVDVRVFGFWATRYIALDVGRDFRQQLSIKRGARVSEDAAAPPDSVTIDLQTFALTMQHDELLSLATALREAAQRTGTSAG
jgi:hypothetical protein